jgi:GAF domain-containing protein
LACSALDEESEQRVGEEAVRVLAHGFAPDAAALLQADPERRSARVRASTLEGLLGAVLPVDLGTVLGAALRSRDPVLIADLHAARRGRR